MSRMGFGANSPENRERELQKAADAEQDRKMKDKSALGRSSNDGIWLVVKLLVTFVAMFFFTESQVLLTICGLYLIYEVIRYLIKWATGSLK